MDIDVAGLVQTIKAQETELVKNMSAEQKAEYMANRAFKAEEVLAQITLDQAKGEIISKYPAVEKDDLAEVSTVTQAEKLAARIQAKADKVTAAAQEALKKQLEGGLTKEDWEKVKKATGKPREIQDTTQNLTSDAEQKQTLGKQLEAQEKIEFGTVKGLETASKWAAGHALDVMFGKGQ